MSNGIQPEDFVEEYKRWVCSDVVVAFVDEQSSSIASYFAGIGWETGRVVLVVDPRGDSPLRSCQSASVRLKSFSDERDLLVFAESTLESVVEESRAIFRSVQLDILGSVLRREVDHLKQDWSLRLQAVEPTLSPQQQGSLLLSEAEKLVARLRVHPESQPEEWLGMSAELITAVLMMVDIYLKHGKEMSSFEKLRSSALN